MSIKVFYLTAILFFFKLDFQTPNLLWLNNFLRQFSPCNHTVFPSFLQTDSQHCPSTSCIPFSLLSHCLIFCSSGCHRNCGMSSPLPPPSIDVQLTNDLTRPGQSATLPPFYMGFPYHSLRSWPWRQSVWKPPPP